MVSLKYLLMVFQACVFNRLFFLRYAEVAVVKRPPLLAVLGCDGVTVALWKPELGASPEILTNVASTVPPGALSLSPSSDASKLWLEGTKQGWNVDFSGKRSSTGISVGTAGESMHVHCVS